MMPEWLWVPTRYSMRGYSQPEHELDALLPVYAQYKSHPGDVILPKSFFTVFLRPPT